MLESLNFSIGVDEAQLAPTSCMNEAASYLREEIIHLLILKLIPEDSQRAARASAQSDSCVAGEIPGGGRKEGASFSP